MNAPNTSDLTRLRELLDVHFNAEELRTLCFDMGLDYDNLPGQGKGDQVRELVAYCARHGSLDGLVAQVRVLRPALSWVGTRWAAAPATRVDPQSLLAGLDAQIAALEAQADPRTDEALRGLRARQAALVARLEGDGAIAQGHGATAVGAGGISISGNVERSQLVTGSGNVVGGGNVQTGGICFGEHAEVKGDVFTGDKHVATGGGAHIEGGVQVLGGDFVGRDKVHVTGGFYQPSMKVAGNNYQAGGNMNVNQGGDPVPALAQLFAELRQRLAALPEDDQPLAEAIVAQVEVQAQKIEAGDDSAETQSLLEKKLRQLAGMTGDIAEVAVAAFANPAAGFTLVLQKIARKVQQEQQP